MSIDATFLGADFSLQSVTQLTPGTIRVRFTQDPLARDPEAVADALNLANYTLTGPAENVLTDAAPVPTDPQAIDLTVAAPLVLGTWTLTVANLLSTNSRPLQGNATLSFVSSHRTEIESSAARNDDPETTIRKHLNPSLRGRVWEGLIRALALGDRYVQEFAQLAFDQLFKISASGLYLDRICGDGGVSRPPGIGLPDDLYRRYAISLTKEKVTEQALLKILEIFYGADSVRAYAETETSEPYSLSQDLTLDLTLDGATSIQIVFDSADFAQITQAKAVEVATAITQALRRHRIQALALAVSGRVRIYSGGLGLGASVRVDGGSAQPALQFPASVPVYLGEVTSSSLYNWILSNPAPGQTRFLLNLNVSPGSSDPYLMDLSRVRAGDYVIIDGAGAGVPGGVYSITDVSVRRDGPLLLQSFDIDGDLGFTGVAQQLSSSGYRFFRPQRHTIYRNGTRTVTVTGIDGDLRIRVPATTQAVGREPGTAAYGQEVASVSISSLERRGRRVLAGTATGHGLGVGSQVLIQGAVERTGAAVPVIAADSSLSAGSSATGALLVPPQPDPGVTSQTLTRLRDGRVLRVGGKRVQLLGGVWQYQDTASCSVFSATGTVTEVTGETRYQTQWSSDTPDLGTARSSHTSTLLEDGRVLVVGGVSYPTALSGTRVFDSSLGQWANGPALSSARVGHTSTLLEDGRVLVVGGCDAIGNPALKSVEIVNAAATAAASGPDLGRGRANHEAIRLWDGRVLVVGGRALDQGEDVVHASGTSAGGNGETRFSSCEIYDPDTNIWTRTGDMSWTRTGHSLTLLPDGRVLVVGGYGTPSTQLQAEAQYIRDVEVYDPGTGRWSSLTRLGRGRVFPLVQYLPQTQDLIVAYGSSGSEDPDLARLEIYSFRTGRWRLSPGPVPVPGAGVATPWPTASVLLDNGLVLADGGLSYEKESSSLLFQVLDQKTAAGGLNGVFTVTSVPDATHFTYETETYAYALADGATATALAAPPSTGTGPYLFSPVQGAAVTGTVTQLTQPLVEGRQYHVLDVEDATSFPDGEGWICLEFGTDRELSPIRYLGRFSDTALLIDYRYRFPHQIPAGGTVTLLLQKGPYAPTAADAGFYATASAAGRVAAVAAVRGAAATGLDLDVEVVYPGDHGLGGEGTDRSDRSWVWGEDSGGENE